MLSGVGLSCYQACQSPAKPMLARVSASLNLPNLNSLTCSSSAPFRWTTAKRQKAKSPKQPRFARQMQASFPAWRAAP
ncbi:hypothetical protein DTW89_11145 [Acidovorax sp. BoFeN1]|nr:hypothetical protein DTW89_11145 [Acidovorax sp. BoFeN1]